jgi:hypothetical protein
MNKLLRNTLIISSFWVLILITGIFFIYGHQKKLRTQLLEEEKVKSVRLNELRALKNNLSDLQNYYDRLHYISLKYQGTLASFESPGETFDYIRRELATTKSSIKMDMDFITENSFKSMMKRQYEFRGIGKSVDIYRLLWFLENGPVFYKIISLSINKIDESTNETIRPSIDEASFNLTMVGFDRTEGPKITELNRDFGEPIAITNLFNQKTFIKKSEPEKKNYASRPIQKSGEMHLPQKSKKSTNLTGLPEINANCKVLAITPFSVLVRDVNGKHIKLRKGDKIFGGNLAELNTQTGQAVFQFDNTFGNKSVVLTTKK